MARIIGELWRTEWVEPGTHSTRVRGDQVPTGIHYIVNASGERLPSESLKDENDPRWLWFRPQVILSLTGRRGGGLTWYTRETGVCCSPAYNVHFGINAAGLITVFAEDVAGLPVWQQQIWADFNTAPEGGVSEELLSAQMAARPAKTVAPEALLPEVLRALDQTFKQRIGAPLFRAHPSTEPLMRRPTAFARWRPVGFSRWRKMLYVLQRIASMLLLFRESCRPHPRKDGAL